MRKKRVMNFSFTSVYKKNFKLKNFVVLVRGNEAVLVDDVAKKLAAHSVPEREGGIQAETLSASEATPSQLSDVLFSLSFFSAKRILIIRNLEDIAFEAKNVLLRYLDSPSPDILLLLTLYDDDRSDRKDRMANLKKLESLKDVLKKITAKGDVVECSLRGKNAVSEWIVEEAGKYGKKLTPSALSHFMEYIGNNASRAPMELKKLSIYCGERNVITEEDISALVVPHFESTTFMMIDAVCAGRTKQAMGFLERLIDQKVKPQEMIYWLSRQFKLLLQAKLLHEKGFHASRAGRGEDGDIAPLLPDRDNLLKINPYVQGKVFAVEKNMAREDIEDALIELHDVDLSLKGAGSPMDEHAALELLIIRLSERKNKNGKKHTGTA